MFDKDIGMKSGEQNLAAFHTRQPIHHAAHPFPQSSKTLS